MNIINIIGELVTKLLLIFHRYYSKDSFLTNNTSRSRALLLTLNFTFLFFLMIVFHNPAFSENYTSEIYLSTIGNDSNNGLSEEMAVASLSKAQELSLDGGIIYVDGFIAIDADPLNDAIPKTGIFFTKNLVVQGDDRRSDGFDGNNISRIINVGANITCSLKNMTFKNGFNNDKGGAIWVSGGTLTGKDLIFDGNVVTNDGSHGGAIEIDATKGISFKSSLFINNSSDKGGAIYIQDTNTPDVVLWFEGCSFFYNSSLGMGGSALFFRFGDEAVNNIISLVNSTIAKNSVNNLADGGTVFLYRSSQQESDQTTLNIINCTITENLTDGAVSQVAGVKIFNVAGQYAGNVNIYNSILEGNYAYQGNSYSDLGYAVTPEISKLTIKNSLIGKSGGQQIPMECYLMPNEFDYLSAISDEDDLVTKLSIDEEVYSYHLQQGSPALGYGNFQFLQAIGLNSDQLGNIRQFEEGKCSAGAVEPAIDEIIPEEPEGPPSDAFLSTNNWYVGNTASGEWIKFRQVWLSEGDYRFTTRAVAEKEKQTVHLDLNGQTLLSGVEIPTNETGEFELAHLGHKHLTTGYYDVRLVFETGNVNCDMIFIRKDNGTSGNVSENDITFSINRKDGMHIAPIGGAWQASSYLAKGGERGDDGTWSDSQQNPYNREQILNWYKQQIYAYTPEMSDQAMDMYVSEQVEAKVDFIFSHGRGEIDITNDIEDRQYLPGIGAFGCRQLKKLVDAINRNVYAKDNLKIAYFIDNAVFPLAVKQYLGKTMNWSDPEAQEFIWEYCFKNFYETIPKSMLFERSSGVIPIQLWTANANYDYSAGDSKILEFLQFIKQKMKDTFNLTPSFILSPDFFTRDSRTIQIAEGIQAWFSWGKAITSYEIFDNKYYGFALNGGRLPIQNVWLNDWNPQTNTGTHASNNTDHHQSSLKADGTPNIRNIYEYGYNHSFEWLVNESWFDWREGSTWYRSNHPEYLFPNQYIALEREFADRESGSIILEAEACDGFNDRSSGNSGGSLPRKLVS